MFIRNIFKYLSIVSLLLFISCGQSSVDYVFGVLGGGDNGYGYMNDMINYQGNGGNGGNEQGGQTGANSNKIIGTWVRSYNESGIEFKEYYHFNSDQSYKHYLEYVGMTQKIDDGTYDLNGNQLTLHSYQYGNMTFSIQIVGNTLYLDGVEYVKI